MLNNSKDINTTIPDIIAKSSSLVNSHKTTNKSVYMKRGKENSDPLNFTQKLKINVKKKMKTLENPNMESSRLLSQDTGPLKYERKYSAQLKKTKTNSTSRIMSRQYIKKPVSELANQIRINSHK